LHTVGHPTEPTLAGLPPDIPDIPPASIRRKSNPLVQPYKQPSRSQRVLFIKPLYDFYKFWTMLRESGTMLRESGIMLREFGSMLRKSGITLRKSGIMLREFGITIRRKSNPLVQPYNSRHAPSASFL
jgi:hypothetical protein